MSTQFLFYREAVPVSSEQHAILSIDTTRNNSFADGVNSMPLAAAEFSSLNRFSVMAEKTSAGSTRSNR